MNISETKMKIMIVEDDETLAGEIGSFLERWGYEQFQVQKFDEIRQEFMESSPQLILMDVNLPFYDGFYWCSQIRKVSNVPVIYISSRNDDRDKIMGIAQGGDDYVEKPFRLEMLKAKIEAVLRRTYEYRVKEQKFIKGGLCFESHSGILFFEGKEVELTKSERRILARMMELRPEVASRDELMTELWNTDEFISDGTLTTVICRLRGKLKAACGEDIIQTKKGQGYFVP
ncbi:MAG: response regulator transcription factor [Lachnospiraceae bacterium]|nr:response regulator transcription factor [Lachnospiraceae bacterium]